MSVGAMLSRHTGMDCRYPKYRDVNVVCHPWHLVSGTNLSGTDLHLPEGCQAGKPDLNPCRNDGTFTARPDVCVTMRSGSWEPATSEVCVHEWVDFSVRTRISGLHIQ